MTDNIDHAAEAREFLNIAYMNESDPHEVVCAHVSAQVHATLALVAATEKVAEQQRIANLIALGQYRIVPSNLSQHRTVIYDSRDDAGALYLRDDIKKGLGLS